MQLEHTETIMCKFFQLADSLGQILLANKSPVFVFSSGFAIFDNIINARKLKGTPHVI